MPRCLHLHDVGIRCISEAISGSDFCVDHDSTEEFGEERLYDHPLRKLLLRLVAFLLLVLLLVPFYRLIRTVYSFPPFEAGETR